MQGSSAAGRQKIKGQGPVADRLILAGDLGATKTRLAVITGPLHDLKILAAETYPSVAAAPEEIIGLFLKSAPVAPFAEKISEACFGVAGPVIDNSAVITNLDWTVDATRLSSHFGLDRVVIVNDVLAFAFSIPLLSADSLVSLNLAAAPARPGNIGLLAAGTGLGQATLVYDNGVYIPCPSEGGHRDFAPRHARECRLQAYLAGKYGHVSVERVLSGQGLTDIYHFLLEDLDAREPAWLTGLMRQDTASAVISGTALQNRDPVCAAALDLFVEIYGAEAGNLALHGLTTGGIYIGGGIGPRIIRALQSGLFMKAFADKGRMNAMLNAMPVKVIVDSTAALIGAVAYAGRQAATEIRAAGH